MNTMAAAREAIVELGRALYDRGVTPGRTGNLSVRVDERILITPTSVSLGRLTDLSLLDLDGHHLDGPPASKESALHCALYARDPDGTRAVAHVHSTYAVAVSIRAGVDPDEPIPPLTAYFAMRVGRLPLVPYFPPGDPALAYAVRDLPAGTRAALLAHHGSLAGAATLEAAVDAVEEIEETARLVLLLDGHDARPLTTDQVAATRRTDNP